MPRRYTFEEVKKYVESFGCKLTDTKYIGMKEKLKMEDALGHEFYVCFSDFKFNGQHQCKECGLARTADSRRLSFDYVKECVESRGCELLSEEYSNNSTPLKIRFVCGHEGYRKFVKFMKSLPVCKKCSGNVPYTLEEIKEKVDSKGYIFVGAKDYKNVYSDLELTDADGYRYLCTYHQLDVTTKNDCEIERFSKVNPFAIENIKLWIRLNNRPFEYVEGEYKGNHSRNLVFLCHECGRKWKTGWDAISQMQACPRCAILAAQEKNRENATKNGNNLLKYPHLCAEWDYEKNSKPPEYYAPNSNKIAWWICSECGYEWPAVIGSRTNGRGCWACGLSGGAKYVKEFLSANKIHFEVEHKFFDLLSENDNPLRYDFAVFEDEKKNNLKGLIEFDGEQHETFIEFFHGTIAGFKLRQQYDAMKTEYAKNNGIPFLRIKHKDFDNIPILLAEFTIRLGILK